MAEFRFGWLGQTRRQSLQALLHAEAQQWLRAWALRTAVEIEVREIADADQAGSGRADVDQNDTGHAVAASRTMMLWSDAGGRLALVVDEALGKRLGCRLADVSEGDGEPATALGREALRELATRLWRKADAPQPLAQEHEVENLPWAESRCGGWSAVIAFGDLSWQISLDRRLADRLSPPAASRSPALTSRQAALAGTRLRLSATLDFGSISLSGLSDLRVGEILLGDCSLDQPVSLGTAGHPDLALAQLRRSENHYAVVLDGHPKQA